MAGLAAAWRLTRPDGTHPEVTVYQRGWRLGGKGASSRGPDGRIQEHGFHVWLGYYDNAFRLLREVYDELDRPSQAPDCPIQRVEDAFAPASTIGLRESDDEWVATFPVNDLVPGEGDGSLSLSVADLAARASSLVASFGASLADRRPPRAVLSTRPTAPPRNLVQDVGAGLRAMATDPAAARRSRHFVELIAVMLRGIAADGLNARGYASIDHLDFREWLARHGASAAVLDGPLVRGVYDLVFGYEGGDRARPRFAAGAGVHLSGRMFLTYRGAIFWRMTAGMGDVVFAPLYEALRRRGVRFEFFHRLDSVHLAADGRSVEALTFGRQVDVPDGGYVPLTTINDLPVFVDRADLPDLESHFCAWPDAGPVRVEAGRDFDVAVLAVSLGMVPHVCAEVLEHDHRWRDMVDHIATVATQSVQVWLDPSERALGARHPGSVLTCCGEPFDTVASMSHTIVHESWPEPAPRTTVSLCAVLSDTDAHPAAAEKVVQANAEAFLAGEARRLWPHLPDAGARAVFARANIDPSDRYVQSLPGSGRFRLRADGSGLANLVLAGDWLDTGLNAGCIEAATLGGLQAANTVEGRPITEGTVGFHPHTQRHTRGQEAG